MKLNEEEMYNAYPWLLTVPRVGNIYLCQEKRILLFVV